MFDECSKELRGHVADPIPVAPGHPAKEDSEYTRRVPPTCSWSSSRWPGGGG